MKKLFAILPALALAGSLQLRAQILVTPHPNLIAPSSTPRDRYDGIDGSAYFDNEWNTGTIEFRKGLTLKNVDAKFDEVTQQILVRYNGRTFRVAEPVDEFKLNCANGLSYHFRKGFGDNKKEYYEVLVPGSATLLKSTAKHIVSRMTYPLGSEPSRSVSADDKYYLYINNIIVSVKPDEHSVLNAIGNKQDVLTNYIKNNNLNLKDQNDFAKLITYYNSI